MVLVTAAEAQTAHDDDYCLWIEEQVALLRNGSVTRADLLTIAEELEGMGRSQKSAVESNLRIVLAHLLKYRYQPKKRSGRWEATLIEHRSRLHGDMRASPSLRRHAAETLTASYQAGRRLAAAETRLPQATFPEICPFTLDQVLDPDVLPD